MYKIVFLDVDGTILSSRRQMDTELVKTVKKLKEKGIMVGIATGRALDGAEIYGKQIGIDLYVVYNGGWVVENGITLFDNRIPSHVAFDACSKAEEWNARYIHFLEKESLSNQPITDIEYLSPFATSCSIFDTQKDAHRVVLYVKPEQRKELMERIEHATCFDEGDRLEVFHNGSKWTGISSLIQKYGISPEEVITIGDGNNDVEMLKEAGLGIAMGNAPDHVKSHANRVTKTSDENGASSILREIFGLGI